MARSTAALTLLGIALLASGCGYRPLLAGDRGRGPVVVQMVENRSPFSSLAGPLTGALRRKLASYGVEVKNGSSREAAILSVEILDVAGGPGMLGSQGGRLVPADAIWDVRIRVSMAGPKGEEMIPPTVVEGRQRAAAGPSASSEEASGERARAEIAGRLADEIAVMVLEVR